MGSLGAPEILLILIVIFLLFGAKKIPEVAQGLGKGIREFKKAMSDVSDEIKIEDKATEVKKEENTNVVKTEDRKEPIEMHF